MSHVSRLAAVIVGLDSLDAGARRLGGELMRGQTSARFYGGRSPCLHAVRFPNRAEYEVGVVAGEREGEFALTADTYVSGGLAPIIGANGELLVMACGIERTKAAARAQGHSVEEIALPNGSVKVRIHLAGGGR